MTQRNKYKCVNSSSPDRSWPILLTIWPEIKKQVPQAELHLYYGFKNWEYAAQYDLKQIELINSLKNRIIELIPLDVVFHDRISQEELAKEFLSASVWVYPTWFSETSCISAMEAQAAGLRIVTSNIAALKETVSERGILLDNDWTSEEYKNMFIDSVITAINIDDDADRAVLQNYAKDNFCLDKLAKNWETMFYTLLEDKKSNPITPYLPTLPYRK